MTQQMKSTNKSKKILKKETAYLNCKGNIIAGCDWSYESQDNPERIVCNVGDLTLDKIEEYANE